MIDRPTLVVVIRAILLSLNTEEGSRVPNIRAINRKKSAVSQFAEIRCEIIFLASFPEVIVIH